MMQSGKIEILLIEDDLPQALLMQEMLSSVQKQHYSVRHVHYLGQGIEALKQGSFDCVIVDLGLPDSQGLESALSVRREAKEVPIVVLTVLDDEETALNALKMDVQDYLVKGEINSAVLTRSIRYAIQRKVVAERLSESEERLRYASQAAGIGMWHWDLVKDDLILSDKSKELLGFSKDSRPTLEQVMASIHPEDRQGVQDALRRVFQDNAEYSEEMRVILPDGAVRWIISKGHASGGEPGRPLRLDGINMDITERKLGEEALRNSELKFSRIFHAAPTLIILCTIKEGRILDVNQTALDRLGYQYDELIGRTVQEVKLLEDPLASLEIRQDIESRKPVQNLEMRYRCKAGDLYIGLASAELIEINGEQCLLMQVSDITELKGVEEALTRAKEEWERTFDSVPDLIAILDTGNRIVRVNRALAERMGKKPEQCIGIPCYAAFHRTETPPQSCPHIKAVAESRQQITEIQEVGSDAYFLVSYTPLLNRDGTLAGVVHVARDITERKQAERRIEQLNAELATRAADLEAANGDLEAFNYTAAHDLRQPLNVVYGYCQAVEMLCGSQLTDDCRGYLHDAYQGVERMTRLLDALLDFSRMNRVELQRARVDLSAKAEGVANELKATEPERNVLFRIAEGVEVDADPALLEIVLNNLLGNAWKYTGGQQNAVIEFGVTEVDGKSAYFVRDNGPGFDMADAERLFAPFQRLAPAESPKGFGIGLATVQRIIARHGGSAWAEGVPGKGATFYFTLS